MGTEHVLVQMWRDILRNAEDYRAGTVITSVDYAKAFNRMSFQEHLKALAAKGASNQVLHLVAIFLDQPYNDRADWPDVVGSQASMWGLSPGVHPGGIPLQHHNR